MHMKSPNSNILQAIKLVIPWGRLVVGYHNKLLINTKQSIIIDILVHIYHDIILRVMWSYMT